MRKFYAEIDGANLVTGKIDTHGAIVRPDYIELQNKGDANLGDLYDPVAGTFTAQPPPPRRSISAGEFFDRLPDAAQDKLVLSNAAAARALVLRLQLGGDFDLDSARLNTVLDRLVPAVLTAAQRANATA